MVVIHEIHVRGTTIKYRSQHAFPLLLGIHNLDITRQQYSICEKYCLSSLRDDRLLFEKKKEIFPSTGFMQNCLIIMQRLDEIFNFRMANCAMLLGSGVKKKELRKIFDFRYEFSIRIQIIFPSRLYINMILTHFLAEY